MAWQQYPFDTKTTPVVGRIREGDPPFFFLVIYMAFINKPINTIALTNITLLVSSFVLVCDLFLQLEEIWGETIIFGIRRQGNWRLWDKLGHVSNWDRDGSEVVKLDEIRLPLDGLGRIKREVHHCTQTE